MKKTRLHIALLVMLVATSGYAQDSYRETVKDYLTATDQFEKSKSLIPTMSMLFEGNDQVDIEQLTKRYLEERYEDDMITWFMEVATVRDMTEADLKEVASLFSLPEGKTFEEHQQEWMGEFLANLMMPFMMIGEDENASQDMGVDEDKDWSSGGLEDLLGPPIQPKADIDAAYAAKFKDVILESVFVKNMTDAMVMRLNQDTVATPEKQESRKVYIDWINKSMPALLLNSAYGNLTLEDLDYAAKLYSNESYCKLSGNGDSADLENLKKGHFLVKFTDWMEEQGAKVTDDPNVAMEFYKSLFNLANLNLDDINPDE